MEKAFELGEEEENSGELAGKMLEQWKKNASKAKKKKKRRGWGGEAIMLGCVHKPGLEGPPPPPEENKKAPKHARSYLPQPLPTTNEKTANSTYNLTL